MALQHLRSSTANKRPVPGNMSDGQLGINTNLASPGLFFKDTNGDLVKVGPVHVGTTAPNASPAAGGTAGNSVGEQWLDTSGGTYVFKVWDGSAWRSESGTFVDVNGDVMTGALGIIAGSAGAPGLYFSGDTNTGIYSPGADQVAISTGGSGRLFVDASGNVGVGVAPSAPFDIYGVNNSLCFRIDGGAGVSDRAFRISNSSNSTVWNINSQGGSSNSGELTFSTNGNERLRITSAGLVGIGTSSVNDLLHLRNGSSFAIRLDDTSNTHFIAAITSPDNFGNGTTAGQLYLRGAAGIGFSGNGGTSIGMVVDSSNRVGIGTTTVDERLHIVGNFKGVDSSGRGVQIINGATPYIQSLGTSNINDLQVLAQTIQFQTGTTYSTTERARIDSSGRLLVGTSSTSAASTILAQGNSSVGATGAGIVVLSRGEATPISGAALGEIRFADNTHTNSAWIQAQRDGGTWSGASKPTLLTFATTADGASSPTERMRIDSTGRLFLNTTASPSTSSFGTAIGTVLAHSRDTSTGAVAQIYGNAGEFRIIGSGNAQNTNNSYGAISDQSLKTDISDAGSQWDDIKGITVRKFKLIGTDTLQIGVVAQECELVSPGLVEDTVLEQEDGTTSTVKAVKYSVLYMKAVKALQEAMERIEQLEQRLAAAGI